MSVIDCLECTDVTSLSAEVRCCSCEAAVVDRLS